MKKFNKNLPDIPGIKQLPILITMLFFLVPQLTSAQTFNVDPGETSSPGTYSVSDNLTVRLINIDGFAHNDMFYFYYVDEGGSNILDENRIIQNLPYPQNEPTGWTFSGGVINEIGSFNLYVGQWNGRFDHIEPIVGYSEKQGTDNTDFPFTFNRSGARYLITNPYDLSAEDEGEVFLLADLSGFVNAHYAIYFEYSTNDGATWIRLNDGDDPPVDEFWENLGIEDIQLAIPIGALHANTRFRVAQDNSGELDTGENIFTIISMEIQKGEELDLVHAQPVPLPGAVYDIVSDDPDIPDPDDPELTITGIENAVGPIGVGNEAIPGGTVTITLDAVNIGWEDDFPDYSFFVKVGDKSYPADETPGTITDTMVIVFPMPTNIAEYYDEVVPFRVLAVDGDDIDEVTGEPGIDVNIFVDYAAGLEITGGQLTADDEIVFNQAGLRQVVTPPMYIHQHDAASLSFRIQRISDQPSEEPVVLEYSVDGTTWSLLYTLPLGGPGGADGQPVVLTGDDFPPALASESTQFRFRQLKDDNFLDEDTWKVWDFRIVVPEIEGETNIELESDPFPTNIGFPSFETVLTDPLGLLFPGSDVGIDIVEVDGAFPDGTLFEVYYDDFWLKTLNELEDFTVTLPLDMGFKRISIRPEVQRESNFITNNLEQQQGFTIRNVELINIHVEPHYVDAGTHYIIPGKEITVHFEMTEQIVIAGLNDPRLVLQMLNPEGDWETIAIEPFVEAFNTNNGGTITTGPVQKDYEWDPSETEIRLFIQSSSADELVHIVKREPAIPHGDNIRYYNFGNITQQDALHPESMIAFNLYLDGHTAGMAQMVYRLGAAAWQPVENSEIAVSGSDGFVTHYANISDFLQADELAGLFGNNIHFGIQYSGIGTADSNLKVNGARIVQPLDLEIAHVQEDINIIYPSLTLETLAETNFYFGDEFQVQYNSFYLDDDTGLTFALVVEQEANTPDHVYHVLAESDQPDGTLSFTFPMKDDLLDKEFVEQADGSIEMDIRLYAYYQDEFDELYISTLQKEIKLGLVADGGDFMEWQGYDPNYEWDALDPDAEKGAFSLPGPRSAMTRALDLTNLPLPVELRFTYQASIGTVNLQTLPMLLVSTDNGISFDTLVVENAFSEYKRLPATGTHDLKIVLDEEYLTTATHFRWKQDVTVNGHWTIRDVKIYSDPANLVDYRIVFYPEPHQEVTLNPEPDPPGPYDDYDNLDTYALNIEAAAPGFIPAVLAGQEFEFEWTVLFDENNDPIDIVWPDDTEFEFYIVLNNNMNANDYLLFATETETGSFESTLPDDVPTGIYGVYVMAWIYEDGERVYGLPGYVDFDAADPVWQLPATQKAQLMVINQTTPDYLEIVLEEPIAVNPEEGDANFYFGGQMQVDYETFGPFANNIRFETVLEGVNDEGNMAYYNLGNQSGLGVISQLVDLPEKEELSYFDLDQDVFVRVYAYCAENEEDFVFEQVLDYELEDPLNHFLIVNNGADAHSLIFDGEKETNGVFTKRYAITKNLAYYLGEGAELDNHSLQFTYTGIGILPPTAQTIPRLQISTDAGVTYQNLEWLFENDTYEIELTQDHLDNAANIHFQWIQDHPAGEWRLDDIRFVSGESNFCEPKMSSNPKLIDLIEIPVVYPDNFTNYDLVLTDSDDEDLDAPVFVDEEILAGWSVIDDEIEKDIWPEGTWFEFTMIDQDNEEFLLGTINDTGSFNTIIPGEQFPTGIYEVSVRAYVGGFDEAEYIYPPLEVNPPEVIKTIVIINQLPDDLRYLVVDVLDSDEFSIDEEVTITFNKYGQWPAETQFAAVLEQIDVLGDFIEGERHVLETISQSATGITVKMPSYLIEHPDFNDLHLKLYAYFGDAIDFGEQVSADFAATMGDEATAFTFDQDGNRWALTDELDLSMFDAAQLHFEFLANDIIENPSTLVRLEASVDGGANFHAVAIDTDISVFGDMGYLPADGDFKISIDLDEQYLTAATQFRFIQNNNRGAGKDTWELVDNVIVEGDGNRFTNYTEDNNPQPVILIQPVIANYEWIIERVDGFEPVLYGGSSFTFTYNVILTDEGEPVGLEYPDGTEFLFYIDNYKDDPYFMDVTQNEDGSFDYALPEDIKRGDYPVLIQVLYNDLIFADMETVGTIKVFNPLLVTNISQSEVLYAGSKTNFIGELMNNISDLNTEWYYNLIMTDNNVAPPEDWVIAVKQGSADFEDIAVPPFKSESDYDFEIRASMGAPMGLEGQLLENLEEKQLAWADGIMTTAQGQRVTIHDYEDLTDWPFIAFDLEVETLDLTESQSLVLEYSTDNGVSYNTISTYPNAEFEFDETINMWEFSEMLELPEAARTDVILRFRIEEFMKPFEISNARLIDYVDYYPAPMSYRPDSIFIAQQRIDIVGTDALAYCNTGVVELNYLIRGQFGAENIMTVASDLGDLMIDGNPITFTGITHGSGTVSITLSMLDTPITGDRSFKLNAVDQTVDGYGYTVNGSLSEVPVEIIPVIPSTGLSAQIPGIPDHISCSDHERIVIISDVVEGFSYQLRNFVTGAEIGDAVVADPDDDDLTNRDTYPWYDTATNRLHISIGTIAQLTRVEVLITAQDSSGELVCQVEIPNQQVTFDIRPLYSLYYDWDNTGWVPAAEGQEFVICDGSAQLNLTMGYFKAGEFERITSNAKWYRGELSMPVANDTELNDFVASGVYFAVYDDGACGEYQSVTITVTVNEKPEQPAITVDGETISNFEICHGETVVLEATEGFAYYRWTLNGTTVFGNNQSITAAEAGVYRVEVSNVPPGQECWSDWSTPVNVIVNDIPDVLFAPDSIHLCHDGDFIAEVTVTGLLQDVTYTLVNNLTEEVVAEFSSTNNMLTFNTGTITETAQFSVHAVHDINGCTKMVSGDDVLTIHVLEQYHILAYNGTFFEPAGGSTLCEGTMLAVGMEDGTYTGLPVTVKWYRNDLLIGTGFSINTDNFGAGVYHARWMLNDDCLYYTEAVTITAKPGRPVIVYDGGSYACPDEFVVLTVTNTFTYYQWYRGNTPVGNNPSLAITQPGSADYTVRVSDAGPFVNGVAPCQSERSLPVRIDLINFAEVAFATSNLYLCEAGEANIRLTWGGQQNVIYQLVDLNTGAEIGEPFHMTGSTVNVVASIDGFTEIGVMATHELAGCEAMVHSDKLTVQVLPQFHVLVENVNGEWEPVNDATYCENVRLAVGTEDGDLDLVGGTVNWFRNGEFYKQGQQLTTTLAGEYHAQFIHTGCSYFIADVVTIGGKPDRPVLTYQGSLEFCEGEGDLVLTAPAGFAGYIWYNHGVEVTDVETTDNELQVVQSGEYRVRVINDLGCESDRSLPITAVVHPKPLMPLGTAINDILCEPGIVSVMVQNSEHNVMYQLYNVITGEATGQARMGQANLVLHSDPVDHSVILEIRAHRLGVQGCASVSAPIDIHVYNLKIIVSGNTLMASIAPFDPVTNPKGATSYQWYRNGNRVVMGGNGQMLSIYDDADYTVVVTTPNECVLEASIVLDSSGDIPGEEESTELVVFPNPAKEEITIRYESSMAENINIRIFDIRGDLVYDVFAEKASGELEYTIPILELNTGIYFIHVIGQEDVKVQQFIKF